MKKRLRYTEKNVVRQHINVVCAIVVQNWVDCAKSMTAFAQFAQLLCNNCAKNLSFLCNWKKPFGSLYVHSVQQLCNLVCAMVAQ